MVLDGQSSAYSFGAISSFRVKCGGHAVTFTAVLTDMFIRNVRESSPEKSSMLLVRVRVLVLVLAQSLLLELGGLSALALAPVPAA